MKKIIHQSSVIVTLLSSGTTLICCAIPAILVLLGAGSTVAALVGVFPQLVWLSEHKAWLFGFGAVMLVTSRYLSLRPASCPIDPVLSENCRQTQRWSGVLWWISAVLYLIGLGVAYVLPVLIS